MMKDEFEKLAGYEVSSDDYYNIIEKMYMASNLDKAEFVKTLNKKRFALKPLKAYIKEMKAIAEDRKENCTHYCDYEAEDRLHELAHEYADRKYGVLPTGYRLVGVQIDTEQIWSCYYPSTLTIYSFKDYHTIETIKLA